MSSENNLPEVNSTATSYKVGRETVYNPHPYQPNRSVAFLFLLFQQATALQPTHIAYCTAKLINLRNFKLFCLRIVCHVRLLSTETDATGYVGQLKCVNSAGFFSVPWILMFCKPITLVIVVVSIQSVNLNAGFTKFHIWNKSCHSGYVLQKCLK